MKSKCYALLVPLVVLLWGSSALPSELKLYREADKALGNRNKVLLAAGSSRVVVWKDRAAPGELGMILLSDLRKYPEEVFFTLPGYFVSAGAISPKAQQCSWLRIIDRKSIVYACGIAMKQNGRRELVTPDMIAGLTSLLKEMRPVPVSGRGDLIELVYLIKPSSKHPS